MVIYKKELIKETTIGKLREKAIKVTRQDGKEMDPEDIRILYNNIKKETDKLYPGSKIMVKALNPIKWFTLKGYSDDDIDIKAVDEYLDGKVHDDAKFGYFYQVQLFLVRNI